MYENKILGHPAEDFAMYNVFLVTEMLKYLLSFEE
jgi:hypothetical protein